MQAVERHFRSAAAAGRPAEEAAASGGDVASHSSRPKASSASSSRKRGGGGRGGGGLASSLRGAPSPSGSDEGIAAPAADQYQGKGKRRTLPHSIAHLTAAAGQRGGIAGHAPAAAHGNTKAVAQRETSQQVALKFM